MFLSLKGDCTGSSEFTLVKMPHCCKAHAAAHMLPSFFQASASSVGHSSFYHVTMLVPVPPEELVHAELVPVSPVPGVPGVHAN